MHTHVGVCTYKHVYTHTLTNRSTHTHTHTLNFLTIPEIVFFTQEDRNYNQTKRNPNIRTDDELSWDTSIKGLPPFPQSG